MLELKNICKTFNGGTVNEKKVFVRRCRFLNWHVHRMNQR